MRKKQNLFYPGGKPLCLYTKNSQTIYDQHGNYLVRPIGKDRRYTLAFKIFDADGEMISRKIFDKDSSDTGRIQKFDPDDATDMYFFVDFENLEEFTFLDEEKTRLYSHAKLDPDTLALIHYKEYHDCGRLHLDESLEDNLQQGEAYYYTDQEENRLYKTSLYKKGLSISEKYLDKKGKVIEKKIYEDESTGNYTWKTQENGFLETTIYRNDKMVQGRYYKDGILQQTVKSNKNGKIVFVEAYDRDRNGEIIQTVTCEHTRGWNKQDLPLQGLRKSFDAEKRLIANSDFIYDERYGEYISDGLQVIRDFGIKRLKKDILLEKYPCEVREENDLLVAWSDRQEAFEQQKLEIGERQKNGSAILYDFDVHAKPAAAVAELQKQDLFYPNKKPLVRYEKDRKTIYDFNGGSMHLFLDQNGLHTHETEHYMPGFGTQKKSFYPNSKTAGSYQICDENGELELDGCFVIEPKNCKTTYFADKAQKQIDAIERFDPCTNERVQLTMYYPSGRIQAHHLRKNGLFSEVYYLQDDADNTLEEAYYYDAGLLKKEVFYPSISCNAKNGPRKRSQQGADIRNFSKTHVLACAGKPLEENFYDDLGRLEMKVIPLHYSGKNKLPCPKGIYKSMEWNEAGEPTAGYYNEYSPRDTLVSTRLFTSDPQKGKFVLDNVEINRYTGLCFYENGHMVDVATVEVIQQNDMLIAASHSVKNRVLPS
ncbi:MAG: hypothetical protein JWM96_519 [Alphaproteobacteria bacterium]|nr:hypothetical protein [Alphaproteobacteria bacterium]